MNSTTIGIFILAIVFNALANILIKASALKKSEESLPGLIQGVLLNPWLISGLACFGLALLAYRYVLEQGFKLSITYPIMTTCGFAIVIIASRLFFNETLNLIQWGGILFLLVGIWLIASQVTAV